MRKAMKNVRLELMIDGMDGEIAFEVLERLIHRNE
jgi:hypothetical protein